MTERSGHAPASQRRGDCADHVPVIKGTAAGRAGIPHFTDVIELARIRACLAGGGSVLVGSFISGGPARLVDLRCIVAAAAIFMAVAAANVVNDIVDLPADAASGRSRPLSSGRISVRAGRAAAIALATGALLAAFVPGAAAGLEMAVLLTLAIAYSYVFKGTVLLGTVVVACCASFPVIYGGAIAGHVTSAIWAAAALSFLFIISYETLKTLRDREADSAAGLRTLATSAMPDSSVWLFLSCAVLLGAVAIAASVVSTMAMLYLISILPLLVLLTAATAPFVRKPPSDGAIQRSLHLLRMAWLVGLIDMLLLR